MKVTDLENPGLKLVELDKLGDHRGFFVERYNRSKFEEHGLPLDFVQDNHSRSAPGILRGLHYQYDQPQGKLVGVATGRIWDVAVDIREGSPTYGRSYGVELNEEKMNLLWIPAGFAHGFCVVGDGPADVIYKVDSVYNARGEGGLMWNDPAFGISWPVTEPRLSARDEALASFEDYRKKPVFRYRENGPAEVIR